MTQAMALPHMPDIAPWEALGGPASWQIKQLNQTGTMRQAWDLPRGFSSVNLSPAL